MNQTEKVSSFPALGARGSAAGVAVLITAMVMMSGPDLRAQEPATNNVPVNTVVATVVVGSEPAGVVVSPDNKFVYVANFGGNVSIINAATNTVQTTIPAGLTPAELAISSNGGKLYVSNEVDRGTVTVINLADGNSTQTITGLGSEPYGLALTPDGTQLWVADFGGDKVDVIDTGTNKVVSSIVVGLLPSFIAFTPDGSKAYVSSNHRVFVIDVASQTVKARIHVTAYSLGIAITPDGKTAYVINFHRYSDSGAASVIDTTNDTLIKTIPLGSGAPGQRLAILPNGSYVYYPEAELGGVTLINTATNSVVGGFACGQPGDIAISPDGTHAYVTDSIDDIVSVVQISQ